MVARPSVPSRIDRSLSDLLPLQRGVPSGSGYPALSTRGRRSGKIGRSSAQSSFDCLSALLSPKIRGFTSDSSMLAVYSSSKY